MRHPSRLRNTPKDEAQSHLEGWKHDTPGRRTRTEVCEQNRVCYQQELVAANHLLPTFARQESMCFSPYQSRINSQPPSKEGKPMRDTLAGTAFASGMTGVIE